MKKQRKRGKKSLQSKIDEASIRRRHELIGIALVAVAVLSLCGLLGFNAGFVGLWLARFFRYFFGVGSWIFIAVLLWVGGTQIVRHQTPFSSGFFGVFGFLAFALSLYHHFAVQPGAEILPESLPKGGGLLGGGLLFLLRKVAGVSGALVVMLSGLLGTFVWTTKWSLANGILRTRDTAKAGASAARSALGAARERMEERRARRRLEQEQEEARLAAEPEVPEAQAPMETETVARPAMLPVNSGGERKFLYNQAMDEHFAGESVAAVPQAAMPEMPEMTPQTEEPSMSVVRPKTGKPARDGFMERLRRRSEARTRMAVKSEPPQPIAPQMAQPATVQETSPQEKKTESAPVPETEILETVAVTSEESPAAMPISKTEEESVPPAEKEASENAEESLQEATENIEIAEESFPEAVETAEITEMTGDGPEPQEPPKSFSIEYSRDGKTEEVPSEGNALSEADAQDALARAMNRALGHDDAEAEAEADTPKEYRLPKVSEILEKRQMERDDKLEREIEENARILAQTLEDFRVKADIINACHGPAVTRYELKPAPGVKVSKIENLADDLALALAAFSVRIEPVPGKAAIGVEVPNKKLEGVTLRDVLEDAAFLKAASPLTVGLGIDIGGQAIFADLGAMPHLLIAGATGSGKSVCVNTLITSILFKARPDEVKFIMIDPKMVELSNYNGIPHLMVPVVTDSKKAASVLNWAVQEMEKRYAKFAELGVRKMADYNDTMPEDKMPAIVIIIDELADLIMVAPKDVEQAIFRLAQKASAACIHLVLATQRPSVDVITGTIKTNIPSRISFAVSSQIDSRTILDTGGAEKLLGKGDMLFYPIGAAKPMRVQGAFISDEEIERLLEFVRSQCDEPEPDEEIMRFTEEAAEGADEKEKGKGKASQQDELLEKAVDLVLATGQASTSGVQRRFRIGYTRAGRLIDTMEELGIVGPNVGSKPRDILVTKEEAEKILANLE